MGFELGVGETLGLGFNVFFLFGLGCCVSRTVTEDRGRDSRNLTALSLATAVPTPDHFTFAIVGDLHIAGSDTGRFSRILAAAKAESDAFVVLLGDLVDQGDAPAYASLQATITAGGWTGLVFPVLGNHDVFNDGWQEYKKQFGPSYYSFAAGNSKFLALDTADGTLGSDQIAWLEGELRAARPTNLFMLSHYLPVVPGQRTYLKLSNETESAKLMKLATDHHVAGWLGAHYHSFIVDSVEGVSYVVAGGGGGRRMAPVTDYFFVQVQVDGANVKYVLRKVD